MSSLVVIFGGRRSEISFSGGETLLAALRRSGFTLPAACGGRGRCGKCRVSVNGTPRLACKTYPEGGDEVALPDGSVGRILTDTPDTKLVTDGGEGLAAAIDLGTTTIVVRLLDRKTGEALAVVSERNRQASYGGDVISRIQFTEESHGGLNELSELIRAQITDMLGTALEKCGRARSKLKLSFLAGNTVMQSIFAGIPVGCMARAPFTPLTLFEPSPADTLFGAPLIFSTCAAGYVGGDITAGILASGLHKMRGQNLFLDIGTNGEIVLGGEDYLNCCAAASGPAFEGAGISCGMAGVDGAISHVKFSGGFLFDIIGSGPPSGICGSGLIDLISELVRLGGIDSGGRLLPPEEAPEQLRRCLRRDGDGNGLLRLTGDIRLTAADVRALQLAKAAIAAGVKVLLSMRGIGADELDGVYLAGGFGCYLNPESAVNIGMLPRVDREKIHALGNTSLAGASMAALSASCRAELCGVAKKMNYTELSGRADFSREFTGSMEL